ncbi:MAG: ABC transporter permease [Clostridium sp.]|nr:ABC transporter permease [Clostridium sp.]
MFVVLCIIGLICSGQTVSYVMYELFGRLSRNAFIVLALIIPIVAGMGINFAITIGAMAAQIAALWVIEWGISGLTGFLVAMLMTMPIAAFFGYLIGKLMNKMKGQEMIGGLILGYFANGLYQLLFLFIFGNLIPLKAPGLVIKGSTGVANTIDLSTDRGFKYALDGLLRVSFSTAVLIICGIMAVGALVMFAMKKMEKKKAFTYAGICVGAIAMVQFPVVKNLFSMVSVPMVTFFVVGLLCIFNNALMKTKIGQQFRAVGQNRTVANASGINVDRVRVIAIVISTVLAGWGQLIFVQNMGSFQTYGAHEQVGLYAGAAILVGGASIKKATNGQALLGCILFHLLFIVAPSAGKNLFGDAAIGEYFRVFISYGVIALALVMYAWGDYKKKKS